VALVAPRLPVAEFAARMKRTVDRIDSPLDRELAAIVDDGKRGLDAVLATGALR
jgi:hypothetical protein